MEATRARGRAVMQARRELGNRTRIRRHDVELRLGLPGSGGASAAAESKYVKVSMQGAPYMRKLDLRAYGGYAELWAALSGLAGQQLGLAVPYEDEAGDVMLVGDLPWDMFVDSCKKLLICKRSLV